MQVACPQCGADINALTESSFYRCPFCTSSFVVQDGAGIRQYTFRCTRDDRIAWSALAEALAEKGATKEIEKVSCDLLLLPFWMFSLKNGSNRLVYAGTVDLPETGGLTLPGGDLEFVPQGMDVSPAAITSSEALSRTGIQDLRQTSLVYPPLYRLSYRYAGTPYEAIVSATDRKCYTVTTPLAASMQIPVRHITMICSFTAILIIEGFAIRNILWRAAAFALTFSVSYPLFNSMLRREQR